MALKIDGLSVKLGLGFRHNKKKLSQERLQRLMKKKRIKKYGESL